MLTNMLACLIAGRFANLETFQFMLLCATCDLQVSSHCWTTRIHRVKWRHISVAAVRSPFCTATLSYCA